MSWRKFVVMKFMTYLLRTSLVRTYQYEYAHVILALHYSCTAAKSKGECTMTTNNNYNYNSNTMSGEKRAATAAVANVALPDGTKRGQSSAWEWFESYQHDNDENLLLEILDIQDSNAKGEIVKDQLVYFANWLVANLLKKKYNNES
jgi:hypothetical protein